MQPADVHGRFTRLRHLVFWVLIAVFAALPWVHIGGHPALFIDIPHRQLFVFGKTFNAQDTWLLFFVVTAIGFTLVVITTLWGRIWCGYACPQTVWLEGVYRRIERLIEGPRHLRVRRDDAPMTFDKAWRKTLKHALFLLVSWLVAHVLISYFVSLPALYRMVLRSPLEHWTAFLWASAFTGVFYFNFAFFREQLCLVVCPYGRLQSAMLDRDSMVIGYDTVRGEPRGKAKVGAAKDSGVGDCVDCNRCVVVCPTGIDIRNGLQIECVGCAACVDACDEVMVKLGRAPGLVRYDSHSGFAKEHKRFLRPRVGLYAVLGLVGAVVAGFAFQSRTSYEANLLRLRGAPYTVEELSVRNAFEVHIVNKSPKARKFVITPSPASGLEFTVAFREIDVPALADARVPVFVSYRRNQSAGVREALVSVHPSDDPTEKKTSRVSLVGPR